MKQTLGLVLAVAVVACSSATQLESEICIAADGGQCFLTQYDGGCPASPPAASSACPNAGLACSWGSDARAQCRTVGTCSGAAPGWQLSGGSCGAPTAVCPATMPSADAGLAPCTQAQLGLTCVYSGSAYTCANGCGGPVQASQTDVWCVSPLDAGCPAYVPNLGTECSPVGLACNYNACASGLDVLCQGIWQQDFVACPL